MSTKERRARFNDNPVAEVRSIPSPASSTSSLAPSPGPSTPPPLPDVAFSSPAHSHASISSYPSPPHPPPLTPGVYLHPALAAPSLQYDMRHHPTQSNLRLSPAILATPASSPPLPSLSLRVGGLPWLFTVRPDLGLSPGNAIVTVSDVLTSVYFHLRTAVKADEYNAMNKARKAEIFQAFERRVGTDPAQRGKGLRRVDFLGGYTRAHGLIRAQSKDDVWDVVVH
ncbi:hypothetical protein B0F90DRAFT_1821851 [Multifurca ochricompacta]|uniref:DUF6699 domain-containing protein n=1 Tax=Multifurca ochricompacta TaxID=376703 RepID=A0AAD4LXV4_9AGAM|nr:hypothetical protein B0F90DRAFT_1821851 [Multifurca ochricompacta]